MAISPDDPRLTNGGIDPNSYSPAPEGHKWQWVITDNDNGTGQWRLINPDAAGMYVPGGHGIHQGFGWTDTWRPATEIVGGTLAAGYGLGGLYGGEGAAGGAAAGGGEAAATAGGATSGIAGGAAGASEAGLGSALFAPGEVGAGTAAGAGGSAIGAGSTAADFGAGSTVTESGSLGLSDLARGIPGILGAVGAHNQTQAYDRLAQQYMAMGQPYRDRLAALYADPNAFLTSPEVTTPVQQGTNAMARALSVQGNPIGSGHALQELQDYSSNQLFSRLGEEKNRLAGFGGLASYNAAAPSQANAAIGSQGNMFNAIGAGVGAVVNPQPSLVDLYRSMRGLA